MLERKRLNFNLCNILHNGIRITLDKSVRDNKLISTVMVYSMLNPHSEN